MPQRIQRKRTKGWRLPPNTVSCTRPGKWGNPFHIGRHYRVGYPHPRLKQVWTEAWDDLHAQTDGFVYIATVQDAVDLYALLLECDPTALLDRHLLLGKDLACWCSLDQPCHVDIILKVLYPASNAKTVLQGSGIDATLLHWLDH